MDTSFATNLPVWQGQDPWLYVESHPLTPMPDIHWHSHIELNYLVSCSMTYVSGGAQIHVPPRRIVLLWASIPHQVTEVRGDGEITCAYVALQEFTRWNLPVRFRHDVMHGGFLISLQEDDADALAFERWRNDCQQEHSGFQRQALEEIQLRLRRMALEGWELGNGEHRPVRSVGTHTTRGIAHVEAMATFIAKHYQDPIGVSEVAKAVGLHPNYAMNLFKRVVGLPIAAYITRHRLSHAQAMLLNTDHNILDIAVDCGFGSLSRFYEAFRAHLKKTPRQYREEWRSN